MSLQYKIHGKMFLSLMMKHLTNKQELILNDNKEPTIETAACMNM